MHKDIIEIDTNFLDVSCFFKSVFANYNSECCNGGFNRGKILSVDYGTRKIGIAVSDENCEIAFPKDVLIGEWRETENVILELEKIVKNENIKGIVFGLPKTLDNELHENCYIILDIVKIMREKFKLPLLLFDERYTTKMANFETKFDRKNKKKYDDSQSATIILDNVLNVFHKLKS